MEEVDFSWSLIRAKDSDALCVLHFLLLHFLTFFAEHFLEFEPVSVLKRKGSNYFLFFSPEYYTIDEDQKLSNTEN